MVAEVPAQITCRIEPEKRHAAEVADQHAGLDLCRKIDRSLRVAKPLVVLLKLARGGLKQIRRRLLHACRQRAEIVRDRKSTRLNSSHQIISYAVFCLKKKKDRERTD